MYNVYFAITSKHRTMVKIGITSMEIYHRLHSISNKDKGCKHREVAPMHILYAIPTFDRRTEWWFKSHFRKRCIKGEWFDVSHDEIRDAIRLYMTDKRRKSRNIRNTGWLQ